MRQVKVRAIGSRPKTIADLLQSGPPRHLPARQPSEPLPHFAEHSLGKQ